MQTLSDDEFIKLSNFTRINYGIDLSHKRTMVESRLQNYLTGKGYGNFLQYFQTLVNDKTGVEASALVNRISTNYTFFMREVSHFNFFRDTILPYLDSTVQDKDLRVWSAGCSTGEEPYTLAMIMTDYFGTRGWAWDKRVLATDISSQVLEIAMQAAYSDEQIKNLPARWKMQYFESSDHGGEMLVKSIREGVIFRKFNLMENHFPFRKKFHVIFCRNVMIYFDDETKRQLIDRLYECTAPGGYLIIGHSEIINRKETRYHSVIPAVYRKE